MSTQHARRAGRWILARAFGADPTVVGRTTNDEEGSAAWRLVGPGYFAALGIPIRGREFTMQDTIGGPPAASVSRSG